MQVSTVEGSQKEPTQKRREHRKKVPGPCQNLLAVR